MINSRRWRLLCTLVFATTFLVQASSRQRSFARGADRPQVRPGQSATLLPDGRWLLIGGGGSADAAATLMILDPGGRRGVAMAAKLAQPRTGHTATVLPDGSVLVVGGRHPNGELVELVERFDPGSGQVQSLPDIHVTPRADHSATLLTDGQVLLAGGANTDGRAVLDAELFDIETGRITPVGLMTAARARHDARLTADGRVRLSGGTDSAGRPVSVVDTFDPDTLAFSSLVIGAGEPESPMLSGSLPVDGARDVSATRPIALRFSAPLQVASANTGTVWLKSAAGTHPATVTPAESGQLVFVRPSSPLNPGETYQLEVRGVVTLTGRRVPTSTITFTVAQEAPAPSAAPDVDAIAAASGWQSLPPLRAAPGVTALAGQVLQLTGAPLAGVTLKIDDYRTVTDHTGRFLLILPDFSGHEELVIDGRTASTPGRTYGVFEVGVDLESGTTTALGFTSWMPRIDTAHAMKIRSPTTTETIVSTPEIPGLEVHIPAGTVIRDIDGTVVDEVSITPIPIDRPPFPLPTQVYVPIYFTVQPGGGYLYTLEGKQSGARLFYPNYRTAPAGKRFQFWQYDPEGRGWFVYGEGAVTGDRRQIVPDPGVRVYEFTGAMVADPYFAPPQGPEPCSECPDGEPVDLGTGLFVLNKTDLAVPDVIPISVTRTYRTRDMSNSRPFGYGASHSYEMFLIGDRIQYRYADLVFPNGGLLRFARISPGTGFADAVFEHTASPSRFYKARMSWNGNGWNLVTADHTTYVFPDGEFAETPGQAALKSITDRFGNTVTLVRNTAGNVTRIQGATAAIDLTYDASNRIVQATDGTRQVGYQYTATGQLWKVTDVAGGVTEYTYDAFGRMRTIKDPRGITYLWNTYDENSRVARQTLADGGTYLFSYTAAGNSVTEADVTDPRGIRRHVTFAYTAPAYGPHPVTDVRAVGRPEQQTITLQRDSSTSFINSVTDTLGRTTSFGYDALGNLTSVTRLAGTPDAVTTTAAYESTYSQLTNVTNPLGKSTAFGRGPTGALVSITDPLQHQVTIGNNTQGQPTSVSDAAGATQIGYSGGVITAVTDPLTFVRSRTLDSLGRPIVLTDALGRTTAVEYSAFNQVTRITDALNGATVMTYDPNGNLLTVTDARSGVTTYTYEAMDRLATRTDALNHAEQYAYDLAGNLVQFTDRRGQVTSYAYDGLNRLTTATYADGSTTSYTYDGGDRVTQVVDSHAGTISLGWDGLDRLTSESSLHGTVSYTYDANDRRTSMTVAGQPTVSYAYDDANRLTQITQGSAVVTVGYDAADRRTSLTLPNGVTVEYGYDVAHQLTGLTYKLGATVLGTLTYTYDGNGRRTTMGGSFARTRLPQPVAAATYNAANQLTQWGSVGLTYDLNGNLLTKGTRGFSWDARNRLEAIGGVTPASFQYDAFDRRTSKSINGVRTDILYDGINTVQELAGTTPTANLLNGPSIDTLLVRTDAVGPRFVLADAVGSVIALTDATGATTTQFTYEPFGATTATGEPTASPTQFTGREADGTGLYYYRARYYDTATQRFVSEDPLGFRGGDFDLYGYTRQSPTNFTDPGGEVIDLIPDLGFIGYDLYSLLIGGRYNRNLNLTALGLDVLAAVIPGITGLGEAARLSSISEHGINQIINRGIRPQEILDTLRSCRIKPGRGDVTRYIGEAAELRINSSGRLVTAIRFTHPSAPYIPR